MQILWSGFLELLWIRRMLLSYNYQICINGHTQSSALEILFNIFKHLNIFIKHYIIYSKNYNPHIYIHVALTEWSEVAGVNFAQLPAPIGYSEASRNSMPRISGVSLKHFISSLA